MPVHQLGLAAEIEPIRELARERGLHVVEDAACALGSTRLGTPVGRDSDACCFSFHPRKIITTGEGGMVVTSDPDLANRLRVLRSQGASIPSDARHAAHGLISDEYHHVGFNYRMTDIQAAIGVEQMKRLPGLLSVRRALARRYTDRLQGCPEVVPPLDPEPQGHAFQSYMVVLDEGVDRAAVMRHMHDRGIATRRAVQAIHLEPCYRSLYPGVRLPATERVSSRGLMLPLFPQMLEQEQDRVLDALMDACERARRRP
jgi:dTDP-4-amino-4,6-dideoxygalactose transaminase